MSLDISILEDGAPTRTRTADLLITIVEQQVDHQNPLAILRISPRTKMVRVRLLL